MQLAAAPVEEMKHTLKTKAGRATYAASSCMTAPEATARTLREASICIRHRAMADIPASGGRNHNATCSAMPSAIHKNSESEVFLRAFSLGNFLLQTFIKPSVQPDDPAVIAVSPAPTFQIVFDQELNRRHRGRNDWHGDRDRRSQADRPSLAECADLQPVINDRLIIPSTHSRMRA